MRFRLLMQLLAVVLALGLILAVAGKPLMTFVGR
jgi:hypothetical protein